MANSVNSLSRLLIVWLSNYMSDSHRKLSHSSAVYFFCSSRRWHFVWLLTSSKDLKMDGAELANASE